MNQDEVESQLSAMFDGELPAAECELLSRRIDRDDRLRARWSRYALIGAAMRCEPVATARADFASRVSRAVDQAAGVQALQDGVRRGARRSGSMPVRLLWQGALAAGMVGAVAGLSLMMLRNVALQPRPVVARVASPRAAVVQHVALVQQRPSAHEPYSYVTPANGAADPAGLRTSLVDYIVAHSEYSTPLVQPNLLSALISEEDAANDDPQAPASPGSAATAARAAAGKGAAVVVDADAPAAASTSGH